MNIIDTYSYIFIPFKEMSHHESVFLASHTHITHFINRLDCCLHNRSETYNIT